MRTESPIVRVDVCSLYSARGSSPNDTKERNTRDGEVRRDFLRLFIARRQPPRRPSARSQSVPGLCVSGSVKPGKLDRQPRPARETTHNCEAKLSRPAGLRCLKGTRLEREALMTEIEMPDKQLMSSSLADTPERGANHLRLRGHRHALVNPRPVFVERIRLHQLVANSGTAPSLRLCSVTESGWSSTALTASTPLTGGAADLWYRAELRLPHLRRGQRRGRCRRARRSRFAYSVADLESAQRLRYAVADLPPTLRYGGGRRQAGIETASELAQQGRPVILVWRCPGTVVEQTGPARWANSCAGWAWTCSNPSRSARCGGMQWYSVTVPCPAQPRCGPRVSVCRIWPCSGLRTDAWAAAPPMKRPASTTNASSAEVTPPPSDHRCG